jgi:thymidylate synthase
MVETLWYLRGEDNILFLQRNRCPYWDAQATGEDGTFVGLNYGLLTNFPDGKGGSINQLQAKVIEPLCRGECSRNMYCSLSKPGEDTVQEACTSGLQFAASDGGTLLSLTVNQRSSDVILGLPNDVVAMSLLLHFVIREVRLQSDRVLHPDKVEFAIAAGGAHVYKINEDDFHQLLERQPKPRIQPYLELLDPSSMISIFDVAKVYDNNKKADEEDNVFPWKIKGYGTDAYHPRMTIQQATDK